MSQPALLPQIKKIVFLNVEGGNLVEPIEEFYKLDKQGDLPDFSYLEPKWTNIITREGGDYHPPSAPSNGAEQFLHDVYQTVRNIPCFCNQ